MARKTIRPWQRVQCTSCEGDGRICTTKYDGKGGSKVTYTPCLKCRGRGMVRLSSGANTPKNKELTKQPWSSVQYKVTEVFHAPTLGAA